MACEECALLHRELRDVWTGLRHSRRNTAKLVQVNSLLMGDPEKLRLEHSRAVWELADMKAKAGTEDSISSRLSANVAAITARASSVG
jgi:hypothetical protein